MWYGMKLDCEGLLDGEPAILEKKCGASEHPAWGVQTASYDLGLTASQQQTAPAPFSFTESAHLYRDAALVIRPSTSQVIAAEGLISFAGINPSVLERKARLGTLVHKVTELYDQGEDLANYEIPDEVWPYVEGWLNFENDTKFHPRLIEHQVLVHINGTPIRPTRARYAVQLGPKFPRKYKLFPYTDPADYVVWMNSLANTLWKINKGLKVFDPISERIETLQETSC